MEKENDPMEGDGVAARPGLAAASGSRGPSEIGTPATAVRQRKPGRWRRIPRKAPTMPVPNPVMLTPKVLPPPGTTDFRPYLPTFGCIPPAGERRESGETRHELPSDTFEFEVVVLRKGSKEEKERRERRNQEYLEKAKRLEEMDEDLCDTEEEKLALRAFKAKFVSFYRERATTRLEDVVLNYKSPSDSDTQ